MSQLGSVKMMNGSRPGRVAALHAQGQDWRVVAVERNGRPRLLEAASVPAGDGAAVREVMTRHGIERLVRVLPASNVICRAIEAPQGTDAETASAMMLIAEASLPSSVPAHRRGHGLIEWLRNGSNPAVLLGWPGGAAEARIAEHEECWTAEPVTLIALLSRGGSMVYADGSVGSVSVCSAATERLVVRSLRENGSQEGGWRDAVENLVMGTLGDRAAGLLRIGNETNQLRMDASSRRSIVERVDGVQDDDAWLGMYAVALGAAVGAVQAGESSRGLYQLMAEPPRVQRSLPMRVASWISVPRNAAIAVGASLLVAMVAPLAFASLRQGILSAKGGGLSEQQAAERADALRVAFADQLEQRRWPMSKLLADLSGALPLGVVMESVRLEPGQRGSVRGVAESLDQVNQLQLKLNESGVFADASIDRTQAVEARGSGGGGIEFDVSMRIARAHAKARGLEDFAAQSLSQRLYGEESTEYETASAASSPRSSRRAAATASSDAAAGESSDAPARERASRGTPKPADVPAPITDEAIAALDANTAMKEWTNRQKASKQAGLDAATRDRLKAEADKARVRMQAARKEAAP